MARIPQIVKNAKKKIPANIVGGACVHREKVEQLAYRWIESAAANTKLARVALAFAPSSDYEGNFSVRSLDPRSRNMSNRSAHHRDCSDWGRIVVCSKQSIYSKQYRSTLPFTSAGSVARCSSYTFRHRKCVTHNWPPTRTVPLYITLLE